MSNNSIGSFLAALRKANGMTQKQLAEKLNVSDKAISRWERDECAPDLSLIPVLAELYGVTSDEILRGQRADPAAAPTPQSEAKTQKRLQYLLNQVKTSYQTRSLISCMIAAIGLIAAMICDLGFNRAYLGFLCGSIFFVAALICQTIYLVQSKAALQNEDFDPDAVLECKKQLLRLSELIYSIIAVLFAFTIPLMTVPGAYWGLTFGSWLGYGFVSALLAGVLSLLICYVINIRRGISRPIDWKTPTGKLRIRTISTLLIILIVTMLLQGLFSWWLDKHLITLTEATKFDTLESFKAYMEQPITDEGTPLTYYKTGQDEFGQEIEIFRDADGNEYWYYPEHITESLHNEDGEEILCYKRYNENCGYITYSSSSDKLPILVQTMEQRQEADELYNNIMLCWIPLYPIEALIIFLRHRKKKAQLS